jgi:hypothetical protein
MPPRVSFAAPGLVEMLCEAEPESSSKSELMRSCSRNEDCDMSGARSPYSSRDQGDFYAGRPCIFEPEGSRDADRRKDDD